MVPPTIRVGRPASVSLTLTSHHRHPRDVSMMPPNRILFTLKINHDRRALVIMIEMMPDPRTGEQLGLRQEPGNMLSSLCFCLCICFWPRRHSQTRLLCPSVGYSVTTLQYLGSSWMHSLGRCYSFSSRLSAGNATGLAEPACTLGLQKA